MNEKHFTVTATGIEHVTLIIAMDIVLSAQRHSRNSSFWIPKKLHIKISMSVSSAYPTYLTSRIITWVYQEQKMSIIRTYENHEQELTTFSRQIPVIRIANNDSVRQFPTPMKSDYDTINLQPLETI